MLLRKSLFDCRRCRVADVVDVDDFKFMSVSNRNQEQLDSLIYRQHSVTFH